MQLHSWATSTGWSDKACKAPSEGEGEEGSKLLCLSDHLLDVVNPSHPPQSTGDEVITSRAPLPV